MTDEPLIYTSKGNLPVASLQYRTVWTDNPDFIKLEEIYTLDGEIVKQSAHVYAKKGVSSDALMQSLV